MATTITEIIWIKGLLKDLEFQKLLSTTLHCDNNAAIQIALNPIIHQTIKHIEVDCHFVREKIQEKIIEMKFTNSEDELADIMTEALERSQHEKLLYSLEVVDIYNVNLTGMLRGRLPQIASM